MPTIRAHITNVEKQFGSDWGSISTDDPVVKKLTTRIEDKLVEAQALKETRSLAEIEYSESERTADDGRKFKNRYYERAKALNGDTPQLPGFETASAPGRREDPERAWRIALQNGANVAVATLPMMPIEQRDFGTQKRIALAWAEFTYFTERPEHAPDEPPPLDDSDVPY